MGDHSTLSERKKQILKAVIDVHIQLGEPVGSKFLTQNQQISLSSATIRNEMAELEEMGYLCQPHTSAGRIPSSAGYRLYVDSLMKKEAISKGESEKFDALRKMQKDAFEAVLGQAGKLVSELTGCMSFAVQQRGHAPCVRRFDGVWIEPRSFIFVMTLDGDTVRSKNMHIPIDLDAAGLARLISVLNEHLAGLTMEQMTLPRMVRMEASLGEESFLLSAVTKQIYEVIGAQDAGGIHYEGMHKLLTYPEFSDRDRLQALFAVLEEKDAIAALIEPAAEGRVHVVLGGETGIDAMEQTALLYRSVTVGGERLGTIGVLGPQRMDYARIIGILDYMAHRLSELSDGITPQLPSATHL